MSTQPAKPRILLRLGIIVLLLAVGGVVAFYQFRPTAVVVPVVRGMAPDTVTGSVVVHADKDLQDIKSDMPGRVVWIDPRQLGEPFRAGEPIVKLDASEFERQRKEAADNYSAALERTKIQKEKDPVLQRAKEALDAAKLRFDRNQISESDFKNAQRDYDRVTTELALTEFDAQQAKIKFENDQAALQRQLDKMTIRAPSDGILQAVMVAPGALIGASTTVATFFSNQRVVIAKVGEEDIGRVKVGQPARVRLLNLGGETFDAKVTTILPFADQDTQRYSVYLKVNADVSKLLPFSTGETTIVAGEHPNQPLVPRQALLPDDFVYVVKEGVVEKRKISIGYKALNLVEVTSNLHEGELVIVDDVDQFRDGEHVRVQRLK